MRLMKKSNSPSFIIVTPTFNQADFIRQTIESVLSQDYPNLSYWIIDGKSSDGTAKVVKPYQGQLHFISEKDAGQTDAINKGVKLAFQQVAVEDSIFAYINSDDYYLPGTFKKVAQAFADHPKQMWLLGDCLIIDGHGREIQTVIRWYKKIGRRLLSYFGLLVMNPIPQPAVFIRAEVVKKLGDFNQDLHYTMDYDYWLKIYQACGKPIVLSEPLAAFRIHAQSKGTTSFAEQFAEQYQVAKTYTRNSLALLLQRLHNQLILLVYTLIK
jgi:glycosyltransferase involved in cell wall biosynthesis